MKILILIVAISLASCSNESAQKKAYRDSALVLLDSLKKYEPMAEPSDDPSDTIRENKYRMFGKLFMYYKRKAETD